MKLNVLDKTGKNIGTVDLNTDVFGIAPNETVLAQYVRVFRFNQRHGTSSTKTRAEVSGGGRKPWRQKGTGRARVGSSRNPIWRHGGISHGPKPKSWNLSLPKKIRALAFKSALSIKAARESIIVIDKIQFDMPKTIELKKVLETIKVPTHRTLLVLSDNDMNVRKSADNIPGLKTALVENLSAYDLILARNVVFLKDALLKVNEKYKA